jgi:hypothetical protein
MARHMFGGGIADWVFDEDAENRPVLQGGAVLTFWNAQSGGSQYTDLALDVDGNTPATEITSSLGGAELRVGQIPVFYGPDGVTRMWASADGGERGLMVAADLGDDLAQMVRASEFAAKGDLLVGTGTGTFARLAKGADGTFVQADSTQSSGLRYATVSGGGGGGTVGATDTLWVAASDAPAQFADADYVCDGVADNVQIQAALDNALGLKVGLSPGTFNLAAPVNLLGVDDVDVEVSKYLHGSGTYATRLVVGSGVAGGVFLGNVVCPHISDFTVEVTGGSHGIYSTRSAGASAGNRSFFHGSIKNIAVKGPWNGTHTGWGLSLGSVFRSVIENIEVGGTGNGVRVVNESSAFYCGDSTFSRIFVDLAGNNGTAYHVSSPVGNANQLSFDTCHAIARPADTGTVCWKFDGAGNASHVRTRNCNAEQFATTVSIGSTASDIDVDLVHVTVRNGTTLASVAGYRNRVRTGLIYAEASATITAINETNAYAAKPNQFDIDIWAEAGATVNATLTTGIVLGTADGDVTATIAGVLKQVPQRGRTYAFSKAGTVTVGAGTFRVFNDSGNDLTLKSARATLGTAFTTGTTTVDINLNGTTIFPGGTNRPSIAANQTTSGRLTTGVAGVRWAAGAYMTVDVDAVGSAGAGADLVCQIETY